jgi:VanZ family protein
MAVISGLSTDAFSAEQTGRFLLPLLRWLLRWASPATLVLHHVMIRKGMHLAGFGILALLWYRALPRGTSGWRERTALAAFVLAAGFGVLDEAHQLLVPSRTASIVDVGWDSLGAALGLLGRGMVRR